ncbi:helix-turn-helix domain-containing protein [Bosea vaviloviae]|uniref:helix-turn-helix domain-containing protein n=1 Tax=Bosea vaviloviae TaxID=1526658 RepID=UPI003CC7A2E4
MGLQQCSHAVRPHDLQTLHHPEAAGKLPVTSGKTLWSYDGPIGQDVSLSEIARRLGIGKASVHRILKARKEMQAAS